MDEPSDGYYTEFKYCPSTDPGVHQILSLMSYTWNGRRTALQIAVNPNGGTLQLPEPGIPYGARVDLHLSVHGYEAEPCRLTLHLPGEGGLCTYKIHSNPHEITMLHCESDKPCPLVDDSNYGSVTFY